MLHIFAGAYSLSYSQKSGKMFCFGILFVLVVFETRSLHVDLAVLEHSI